MQEQILKCITEPQNLEQCGIDKKNEQINGWELIAQKEHSLVYAGI